MDHLKAVINSILPMPDKDLERIVPLINCIAVPKKSWLLQQGQVCKYVYFLTRGIFRMYYVDLEGNEINCRFTTKNNFLVDFQSFLSQQQSRYYWQAMEDSELMAFRYEDVQQLYLQSISWEKFGRLIAERVYQQLNERIEMLQFLSPEERYLHLMQTRPELFSQVSQFHIASYLGIKPESLSRLRKRLSINKRS
ncbi:CRP-like cAMP-binding protein [Mucilaginibacter sp. UYP25]|uniref:Crp/Fnr family transcriptional regulator n=1 Tax=unclassified Mucilaginibacter TaxID=2617802 RepID=UPI003396CFED